MTNRMTFETNRSEEFNKRTPLGLSLKPLNST